MSFTTTCNRCNSIKVEVFNYREGVVYECPECGLQIYKYSDSVDENGDAIYKEEIINE